MIEIGVIAGIATGVIFFGIYALLKSRGEI